MIRAAAKNHADVAVVVDPTDYEKVLGEMAAHSGMMSLELRQKLAAKAYARTAAYDAAISNWFAETLHDDAPDYRAFGGKLVGSAALWREPAPDRGILSLARRAFWRRHGPPAAGQAALLQQHQRHRRRL